MEIPSRQVTAGHSRINSQGLRTSNSRITLQKQIQIFHPSHLTIWARKETHAIIYLHHRLIYIILILWKKLESVEIQRVMSLWRSLEIINTVIRNHLALKTKFLKELIKFQVTLPEMQSWTNSNLAIWMNI